jgi:hypothetical protein
MMPCATTLFNARDALPASGVTWRRHGNKLSKEQSAQRNWLIIAHVVTLPDVQRTTVRERPFNRLTGDFRSRTADFSARMPLCACLSSQNDRDLNHRDTPVLRIPRGRQTGS